MSHFLAPVFALASSKAKPSTSRSASGRWWRSSAAWSGVFTVMRGQSFAGEALGDIGTTGGSGAFLVGVGPLWGFVVIDVIAAARWR